MGFANPSDECTDSTGKDANVQLPPPPPLSPEGVDWEIMKCKNFLGKVGDCKASFAAKWNLHKHAKDKHNLIMTIGNYGHPSTQLGGPRTQNYHAMNALIPCNVHVK
jgi:hypothetical protein